MNWATAYPRQVTWIIMLGFHKKPAARGIAVGLNNSKRSPL
jgi:hypothetical protein